LTHWQVFILSVHDITAVEYDLAGFEKFSCVFLLYESNNCWLLPLIHLNLFYCTFVLKKSHQLILSVERFWNVFHPYRVSLLSVFTSWNELILLKLRTFLVILLRLRWSFLHNWRRGHPKTSSFIRRPWRRWKEGKWGFRSLDLTGWLFL